MSTERALTPKQAAFVAEYLKDLNATQAAVRAGYSAKTAYSQGERLLRNAEVQRALQAAQLARQQRTQIDADWLLKRLASLADADVADLYNDDGTVKPVREWPEAWRKGLVAGIDVVTVGNADRGLGEIVKIKLADRLKNLELIGRHINVGAWRDAVALTGADGGPVQMDVAGMSSEALRELVEARRRAGK